MSKLKFAERSILLIAGSLFKLCTQIIVLMLYARQLSITDYGLYRSVWLYINVISVISLFGLPTIILSAGLNSIKVWVDKNKKTFWFFAALSTILPIVFMFLMPTGFSLSTILLLLGLTLVQNVSIIIEAIAVKNEKEKLVFKTNILFSVLFIIAHLLVLSTNYSLQWLIIMLIGVFFIKSIIQAFKVFTKSGMENTTSVLQGKQWLFLGLNDITGVVFKWFDKWIILFFLSLQEFAVYFNGSYEIPVFGLLAGAAGNIMLVEYSKAHSDAQIKTKALFENSATLLSGVVFPSFCFLLFYSYEFFTYVFSLKYVEAVPIFLVTIFILPLRITSYTPILQAKGRTDIILKGAILDLLTAILLMIIFYPLYKTKGLALACVLSTYGQSAYYLFQTGKLIKKPIAYFFPFRRLIIIMAISVTVMGAGYFVCINLIYPIHMLVGIVICLCLMAFFIYRYYTDSRKELLT